MFFEAANALVLYLLVGAILLFIFVLCVVFMVKSYRAGLAIGMDKTVLKRTITSSATFTLLPSISILLGVIALSGKLGIPISWLRLSVVGALQYELNVAEIAANALNMHGLNTAEMTISHFSTITLVMTVGIMGGGLCSIFFLKRYLDKVNAKPKDSLPGEGTAKPKTSFAGIATVAMFVGLCSAYIGSYIGTAVNYGQLAPLLTALMAAAVMAVFEYFTVKKRQSWLDNFSLAASMLAAMAGAVLLTQWGVVK